MSVASRPQRILGIGLLPRGCVLSAVLSVSGCCSLSPVRVGVWSVAATSVTGLTDSASIGYRPQVLCWRLVISLPPSIPGVAGAARGSILCSSLYCPCLPPQKRAKWDAWNANKGMSKEEAMKKYCELMDADPNWENHEALKNMPAGWKVGDK